jgi:penicillin-binding protein activator
MKTRWKVWLSSASLPVSRSAISGIIVALFSLFVFGCSSSRQVSRVNADSVTDVSGDWNDTDSRLVSETMIKDLTAAGWVDSFRQDEGKKPTVIVGRITNRTYEHIDVTTFVKDLERSLLNDGVVNFVASSGEREQIRDERKDQAREASEETQKAPGQESGADFMLIGNISSIVDKEGGEAVKYYQINMELVNIETNQKVWIGEKKIKKIVSQDKYKF